MHERPTAQSNEPIMTNTAAPSTTAPANGRIFRRSTARRRMRARTALADSHAGDERQHDQGGGGDHDERCRDAERADEQGRDRRAECETEHVGGEQPAEVLAEMVRVGEDDDATGGRYRRTDPDARDEPADEDRGERGAEPHQQQADHIDRNPEQHDSPRMAAVGERGDEHLRQERGDEPDPDDDTDRRFADAVLVAVVVDDREQHAVAGGEAGHEPAERDEQHPRRRCRALDVDVGGHRAAD